MHFKVKLLIWHLKVYFFSFEVFFLFIYSRKIIMKVAFYLINIISANTVLENVRF